MTSQEALVIEDINPEGKVQVMGELWNAKAHGKPFPKGKKVRITGVRGLALIVEDTDS